MQRILIIAVSLNVSLAGFAGAALAQDKNPEGISTNADGSYVTSRSGVNPTANGGGGTIVYGDINTGPGYTVIGPPTVDTSPPAEPAPAPEPAPVETSTDAAPADSAAAAPADTSGSETAVATETDLDADNEADALEPDLGLDPTNADTDGDGVADGDELNIYGTEPTVFDTDGDGISDGEELFGIHTDPLVWDDVTADSGRSDEATAQQMAVPSAPTPAKGEVTLAQETSENMTATDGNATTRGPGSASAAPGRVTRRTSGTALLGPDGAYHVSDTAPPVISVSGDTDVLSPAPDPAVSTGPTCGDYGSWYDAQIAYEAAGMTDADPALVSSLDPDVDGIACEDGM